MYQRAERITVEYTVAGGIFFVICGCLIMAMLSGSRGDMRHEGLLVVMVISFIIGAFIGYQAGVSRAFWCKFAAHQALCQAEIELNTRVIRGIDVHHRA